MTKKKWFALIMFFIIIVLLIIVAFYRNIYRDYWEQQDIVYSVIEQHESYELNQQSELSKYVWDRAYWLLLTENVDGIMTYSVWDEEQFIAEIAYDQVVAAEQLIINLQNQKPMVQSFDIQPGYFYGEFVWEVQYRDPNTDHVKLAFYYMNNGQFIDEYTIPKETRP